MDDPVLAALERDEAYTVVKVLAEKPSGVTELVQRTGDTAFYVRKRISAEIANPGAWAQLAAIDNPHLPRVIEAYALPDAFATVCTYVEGFSVAQLVSARGALDAAQAHAILTDVCDAADALHARGVIHRDITPTNVIVASDGAHLIDLGIARVGDASARHDTTTLGTWGFAAPEQYGFAQTDARSDVYSIGCLAAYMLTGIRPHEAGFEAALRSLPAAIRSCIEKACSFEPSARYGSARELLEAFHEADTVPVRRGGLPARPVRALIPSRVSLSEISIAWRSAGVLKKAAVLFLLLIDALFAWGMYSSVGDINAAAPLGWVVADILMKVALATCIAWALIDALLAFLGAGPYRVASRRAVLWRKRVVPVAVITIAALFAISFVATALFGPAPQR